MLLYKCSSSSQQHPRPHPPQSSQMKFHYKSAGVSIAATSRTTSLGSSDVFNSSPASTLESLLMRDKYHLSSSPSSASSINSIRSIGSNTSYVSSLSNFTVATHGTSSGNKVKPYRFRDEPEKKNIVKTELCSKVVEGLPCRFGSKCNFAHTEGELRYQEIYERHVAGLIDGAIWRTRPCLNHIATGDCPFSLRCACIHDPRISGKCKWWLPHCALKSTHLETDIHVDRDGKYHFAETHYGQPFGKAVSQELPSLTQPAIQLDQNELPSLTNPVTQPHLNESSSSKYWEKFYNEVTNKDCHRNEAGIGTTNHHRVQIALAMRHSYESLSIYNYQPSHKILNEICMLIQTKAFNIKNKTVVEIACDQYDSVNPFHVIVREIAFGPLCSPNDRPLALWFNISDTDIEELTAQEIIRLKRTERKLAEKKKQLQLAPVAPPTRIVYSANLSLSSTSGNGNNSTGMTYAQMCSNKRNYGMNTTATHVPRIFFDDKSPLLDPEFPLYCPKDEAAYHFITETLQHRIDALDPAKDTAKVAARYNSLEEKYWSLMRHFSLFHWPVNKGRENIDKSTIIPKIDTRYEVPVGEGNDASDDKNSFFHSMWQSFLDTSESGFAMDANNDAYATESASSNKKRLDIFINLSKSLKVSSNDTKDMPFIKKHKVPPGFSKNVSIFSKQEDMEDWETVHTHYLSKKSQQLTCTPLISVQEIM